MGFEFDEWYDDANEDVSEINEILSEGSVGIEFYEHTVTHEADGLIREQILTNKIGEVEEGKESIIGEPLEDMEHWHLQGEMRSCVISCQEFMAEGLLNKEFDEKALIHFAEERGWYENGTTCNDAGNILEYLGLDVESQFDCEMDDIEDVLESGGKVMVSVNNHLLANPELSILPFWDANHAVEVIGIDKSNEDHIKVILNDPGVENGCGIEHDLDDFMEAWESGGNFMIGAFVNSITGPSMGV